MSSEKLSSKKSTLNINSTLSTGLTGELRRDSSSSIRDLFQHKKLPESTQTQQPDTLLGSNNKATASRSLLGDISHFMTKRQLSKNNVQSPGGAAAPAAAAATPLPSEFLSSGFMSMVTSPSRMLQGPKKFFGKDVRGEVESQTSISSRPMTLAETQLGALRESKHLEAARNSVEESGVRIPSDLGTSQDYEKNRLAYNALLTIVEEEEECLNADLKCLNQRLQEMSKKPRKSIRSDNVSPILKRLDKSMSSESMNNSCTQTRSSIFEMFLVVGPDLNELIKKINGRDKLSGVVEPVVSYEYPHGKECEAESVERFCFPKGIPLIIKPITAMVDSVVPEAEKALMKDDMTYFLFLIAGGGDSGTDIQYASCMYKWITLPLHGNHACLLRFPICYCLISQKPFVPLFHYVCKKLLQEHSCDVVDESYFGKVGDVPGSSSSASSSSSSPSMLSSSSPLSSFLMSAKHSNYIQTVLHNLNTKELPGPGESMTVNVFPDQRNAFIFSRTPVEKGTDEESMLLLRWGLPIALRRLSIDRIVQVLGCLMVEMRVVVVGMDLELLSAFILVMGALLRPLIWAGPMISVLPKSLYDCLEAPVPFIIGIQSLPTSFELVKGMVLVFPETDEVVLHESDLASYHTFKVLQSENLCRELTPLCEEIKHLDKDKVLSGASSIETIIRRIRCHMTLLVQTALLLGFENMSKRDDIIKTIGPSGLPFMERFVTSQMYQNCLDKSTGCYYNTQTNYDATAAAASSTTAAGSSSRSSTSRRKNTSFCTSTKRSLSKQSELSYHHMDWTDRWLHLPVEEMTLDMSIHALFHIAFMGVIKTPRVVSEIKEQHRWSGRKKTAAMRLKLMIQKEQHNLRIQMAREEGSRRCASPRCKRKVTIVRKAKHSSHRELKSSVKPSQQQQQQRSFSQPIHDSSELSATQPEDNSSIEETTKSVQNALLSLFVDVRSQNLDASSRTETLNVQNNSRDSNMTANMTASTSTFTTVTVTPTPNTSTLNKIATPPTFTSPSLPLPLPLKSSWKVVDDKRQWAAALKIQTMWRKTVALGANEARQTEKTIKKKKNPKKNQRNSFKTLPPECDDSVESVKQERALLDSAVNVVIPKKKPSEEESSDTSISLAKLGKVKEPKEVLPPKDDGSQRLLSEFVTRFREGFEIEKHTLKEKKSTTTARYLMYSTDDGKTIMLRRQSPLQKSLFSSLTLSTKEDAKEDIYFTSDIYQVVQGKHDEEKTFSSSSPSQKKHKTSNLLWSPTFRRKESNVESNESNWLTLLGEDAQTIHFQFAVVSDADVPTLFNGLSLLIQHFHCEEARFTAPSPLPKYKKALHIQTRKSSGSDISIEDIAMDLESVEIDDEIQHEKKNDRYEDQQQVHDVNAQVEDELNQVLSSPHKLVDTSEYNNLVDFRRALSRGFLITKFGKQGKARQRLLSCDESFTRLYWAKLKKRRSWLKHEPGTVLLLDIVQVLEGREAAVFRHVQGLSEQKCFSLHTPEKIIGIYTEDPKDYTDMVNGFRNMISYNRNK